MEQMWADVLTKEMRLPEALERVLTENMMDLPNTSINEVKAFGTEVRMQNIRNRSVKESDLKSKLSAVQALLSSLLGEENLSC